MASSKSNSTISSISLSVLVYDWQYCALVFFWQLLTSATTRIQLFHEFHHCHHFTSLPNLIHLHLFHCRNFTIFWTRGSFHPSSNSLQYGLHVHYRRHLTHQNTPERRCTKIPVFLPWSLCHRKLSKHVAQWDRTTCKDVAICVDGGRHFVYFYTISLHRFFLLQGTWSSVLSFVYPEWQPYTS